MNDRLIQLIAKLLTKAADPAATPPEAEAFHAKALSLMVQHRINETEIRNAQGYDPGMTHITIVASTGVPPETSMMVVCGWLIGAISGAYGCIGVLAPNVGTIDVVGSARDLRIVKRLYELLIPEMLILSTAEVKRRGEEWDSLPRDPLGITGSHFSRPLNDSVKFIITNRGYGWQQRPDPEVVKRDYCLGFCATVGERLMAANVKADEACDGTLLPMITETIGRVRTEITAKHGDIPHQNIDKPRDMHAFAAGIRAAYGVGLIEDQVARSNVPGLPSA